MNTATTTTTTTITLDDGFLSRRSLFDWLFALAVALGGAYAFLQYPAGSVNPPRTHPRATELLYLLQGTLEVGFVDTTNKLYTQTLQTGDMFIFPKGLVHYQYNSNTTGTALALSAFGSANAGTVSLPVTLFAAGVDDGILAKYFKTDLPTIQNLKAGFAPKA